MVPGNWEEGGRGECDYFEIKQKKSLLFGWSFHEREIGKRCSHGNTIPMFHDIEKPMEVDFENSYGMGRPFPFLQKYPFNTILSFNINININIILYYFFINIIFILIIYTSIY